MGTPLRSLLRTIAGERGIEIDDDDLDQLGLADDDEEVALPSGRVDDVLSQALPGEASGQVEIFLAAESTSTVDGTEQGSLMWYPIIREGQWAVRPGGTAGKRRVPLKVIAGKSKNQRRQIGLQDLKDAFDDEAIQHVTVPASHNNTVLENQGFIRGMKILDGEWKDQKTKKMVKGKVLMGGYDFTELDTKDKIKRGTIANRSAGILYDYVNTETGKTYPAVIEHVALTNKPWITGMISFGRKLSASDDVPIVGLSLSDVGPDEHEYALALSDEVQISGDDLDFLAQESKEWSKERSPNWLRKQVDSLLSEAREKKVLAKRAANSGQTLSYIDEFPPRYRCVEATPGQALISDDWGEDANHWAAPITVKNGAVELGGWDTWVALKKAYIADERPAPPKDKLPLDRQQAQGSEDKPKTRLQLAQERRRTRAAVNQGSSDNDTREVVTQDMAGDNGTLQLSEEAQRAIQAAENRAAAAEKKSQELETRLSRVNGTVQGNEVEKFIGWLKSDEGLGLSEERGFGGALVEIRNLMLADDDQPAVQADYFADDKNTSGELTLSEAIKRIFGAFAKTEEGKKKLGDQLSQPADPEPGEKPKDDIPDPATAGKPAVGDEDDVTKLSTDEKVEALAEQSPSLAALTGIVPKSKDTTKTAEVK